MFKVPGPHSRALVPRYSSRDAGLTIQVLHLCRWLPAPASCDRRLGQWPRAHYLGPCLCFAAVYAPFIVSMFAIKLMAYITFCRDVLLSSSGACLGSYRALQGFVRIYAEDLRKGPV